MGGSTSQEYAQNYNYQNNWWFYDQIWQHQMMWQQQQMMQNIQNSVPKFEPSPIENVPYFSVAKKNYFELVLDLNTYDIIRDEVETIYPDIDKMKMVDKFEKFKKIKELKSHVFIDKILYNFAYYIKGKTFMLYETLTQ